MKITRLYTGKDQNHISEDAVSKPSDLEPLND